MAKRHTRRTATVGVVEHGNSAELVTLGPAGTLLDRRRIDLTEGLPTHPYHHQGSWAVGRYLASPWAKQISLPEAIALVERVRAAAAEGAEKHLEALAADVGVPIGTIALRACPELPPTIEETIRDNRAQSYADTVMYRQALARAGEGLGWTVYWYDKEEVYREAAAAVGGGDVDALLEAMGRQAGPPWRANHRLAAAAALAASSR